MISNHNIGKDGRLGNHMFQYASIVGLAIKNNYDYCFPLHQTDLSHFNISAPTCDTKELGLKTDSESIYFSRDIFDKPDNRSYSGYFQDYKYFHHCKDFIQKEFSFKRNELIDTVDSFFNNESYVSIQVRRTDYLHLKHFFMIPSKEWYKYAMTKFPNKKFIVFSDDKNWCKRSFKEDNIVISPFNHYIQDLYAMTKCISHIISNSTFAWWGAYLANSELVIMPEVWAVNDGLTHFRKCCDFIPPSWIPLRLENLDPFTEVFA